MTKYTIKGKDYPGVTTILGELGKGNALLQWAVNCAVQWLEENPNDFDGAKKHWRDVSKEAMDIGSEVHNLIEQYIKMRIIGKNIDYHGKYRSEVENGYLAFLEWEKNNIDKWIESEMTIYNDKYWYAGTLDAVAKLKNNKIYVIDFKSSKGFYDDYVLQISAYRNAYGKNTDGMGILRLDKETGLPEWKDYSQKYEQSIEAFHYLVQFYYTFKKRRIKK